MDARSRRGFFRQLAGEIGQRLIPFGDEEPPREETEPEPEPEPERRATRGLPARAGVTVGDLLDLADEAGLGGRLDAVQALALTSVRLTLGRARPHGSRLGEAPAGPDEAFCLAHIDLAELAGVLGRDSPFMGATLSCFAPVDGDCRVVVDAPPPGAQRWRSIDLTVELELPRVWSAPVQALALDGAEHEAWQRLREQLAERQGVDLHDGTLELQAVHRLLGYPDDRQGDMPLACELLARGHVLGDDPPLAHARAAEAEPRVGRWRLLLQLTIDDDLGWAWGEGRDRLYLWIDERDLANGDFARVRAIAR